MIPYLIFGVASGLFWLGVALDANSSTDGNKLGVKEGTKLFRDKTGGFDLRKYLLVMAALYGVITVIAILLHDDVGWITASGALVAGFIVRFRVAQRNRKIQETVKQQRAV